VSFELALAVYAARRDAHYVEAPQTSDFGVFARAFDERAYRRELAAAGLRWIGRSDEAFPPILGAIHDPPPGLFLRGGGDSSMLRRRAVAVVGARSCSSYGAAVARSLGRGLAEAGLVVVSGLARGVDGEAHRGALEGGGVTVAVLGCGIDLDYPAAHRDLAGRIGAAGLVVSEYPPGVPPAPWRFPARNRIVAGLCEATIVIEARERSGALITADLALEEGRDVFAVPGEIISALSAGTNALLKIGAVPVTRLDDVLEHLGVTSPDPSPPAVGPTAERVLVALREGARSPDEVVRRTALEAGVVAGALVELELCGLVAGEDGAYREVVR
jgi:DNA processing protein